MICGARRPLHGHLQHIRDIIGLAPGVDDFAALSLVITTKGAYFLADTQVTPDPTADEIAEMAVLAAAHVRRFGLEPKIALLSHSDFGSLRQRRRRARCARRCDCCRRRIPSSRSTARCTAIPRSARSIRERVFPHSRLKGEANVLIMPNLDAANIAYQMIKVLADALPVGPILIGAATPGAHPDAVGHRARRRQHDGGRGGRGAGRRTRGLSSRPKCCCRAPVDVAARRDERQHSGCTLAAENNLHADCDVLIWAVPLSISPSRGRSAAFAYP